MPPDPEAGTDYHVNYRGPQYLTDVWYLCGAFDNVAEARKCFAARLAADLSEATRPGSEWRIVGVRGAEVVEVVEHLRLTTKGPPSLLEDQRAPVSASPAS